MKNQYFGDVNDYRKYGLLRKLVGKGKLRIGTCWMLTSNDHSPDGKKTEYLADEKCHEYRHFDPAFYDFLQSCVHGHETDKQSRDVRNFDGALLPGANFWSETLSDSAKERQHYFERMWTSFSKPKADLIFFDPDVGWPITTTPNCP